MKAISSKMDSEGEQETFITECFKPFLVHFYPELRSEKIDDIAFLLGQCLNEKAEPYQHEQVISAVYALSPRDQDRMVKVAWNINVFIMQIADTYRKSGKALINAEVLKATATETFNLFLLQLEDKSKKKRRLH